ncbi:UDP-glucuronosyltransferase 1-9 [Orchesella cincta]|uniref:UDP-glucuronosyltransferase 1-9 n=1 Tax=Orchesella cincta TaxID=48709 RepID=A0A1D2MYC6_ORCCI|nr:UDP-glucuronosyltransferase 1-9 [Orchesella cincta]
MIDYNGERLQRTGRGITLEITSFTQEQLEDAINKLLYDESYKKNVVEVSKDSWIDSTPLENRRHGGVEYVIRHEDTSFMRAISCKSYWYQRRLLDVYAFLS